MNFCSTCDNMYYIKLEEEECDKIVYYCRNCGNIDDKLLDINKCILKENINKSEDKYKYSYNKYTKLDITLPRINYINVLMKLVQQIKKNLILIKRNNIYKI